MRLVALHLSRMYSRAVQYFEFKYSSLTFTAEQKGRTRVRTLEVSRRARRYFTTIPYFVFRLIRSLLFFLLPILSTGFILYVLPGTVCLFLLSRSTNVLLENYTEHETGCYIRV